jgi:hypothetical protein
LQRQDLGQLRSTARILAVDTNLELPLAIPRDPQRAVPAFSQFDLTKHCTALQLVLNHGVEPHTAKRTRQPQQMDSFQHAGFSAAVGAVQDIDAGEGEKVTGCRLRTPVTVTRLRDI